MDRENASDAMDKNVERKAILTRARMVWGSFRRLFAVACGSFCTDTEFAANSAQNTLSINGESEMGSASSVIMR